MDWKLGRLAALPAILVAAAAAAQSLPSFLGVQLGSDFAMPKCMYMSGIRVYEQPVLPCWGDEVVANQNSPLPTGDFEVGIAIDRSNAPSGVRTQRVVVVGGKIAGVTVSTTGAESQADLSAALVSKFGKPAWAGTTTMQNRMGASFDSMSARWKLDGLEVSFLGIGSRIDGGVITVYTPEGVAFKDRQLAEFKARRQGQF